MIGSWSVYNGYDFQPHYSDCEHLISTLLYREKVAELAAALHLCWSCFGSPLVFQTDTKIKPLASAKRKSSKLKKGVWLVFWHKCWKKRSLTLFWHDTDLGPQREGPVYIHPSWDWWSRCFNRVVLQWLYHVHLLFWWQRVLSVSLWDPEGHDKTLVCDALGMRMVLSGVK